MIENAKITSCDLSMANHGCLTLRLGIQGNGWGCVYGNCCIGNGYLGAEKFKSYKYASEYIMRIMDTVGVENFNDLNGKYIRVEVGSRGSSIDKIGHIIKDKWFSQKEFFEEHKEKEE